MSLYPSRPTPPREAPRRPPAVNLPAVVTALIAANVAVFVAMAAIPWRWEAQVLVNLGFVPARYTLAAEIGWPAVAAPLTHQFLHGGWLHLLVNMIMLAAFGSGVARVLGASRMLVLYLVCGLAGAFAHLAVYPDSTIPVVGASGAISGLFGGVLRIMARHPRAGRGWQGVLAVAAIWIGIAVMTGVTGMPGTEGARVAWAAHVGGFALAVAAFDLFAAGRRAVP